MFGRQSASLGEDGAMQGERAIFRNVLLRHSGWVLAASLVPLAGAAGQTAPAPQVQLAQAAPPAAGTGNAGLQQENITVRYAKRLIREKNSPSAVTELGKQQITATGVSGSVATLLRQAPSVFVYQQGIGDNAPVLTIRGVRGLEVASTLDGVPMQDLLNGGTGSNNGGDPALANNIGASFGLSQISGVSIYPGVAYPNKNTFGTIGGTVAYDSLRPTANFGVDLTGEVGSFQTYQEGIAINTGAMDSTLGTGDNAARALLQYSHLETAGFIDYTEAHYNNFEAALDKPYDDGLSKFQATVLYNEAAGLLENEAVPVPYLQKYGLFSNYNESVWQDAERNDFLTIILKDDTYVNDYISAGLSVFYRQNDNQTDTFAGLPYLAPAGVQTPVTVGGSAPFINNPAGFGLGDSFFGPGTPNYLPGIYPYNPLATYPVGSKYCPASFYNLFASHGLAAPCGLNSQLQIGHSYSYGAQPRMTILPPDVYGIANTIQLGGLIAKETSPTTRFYYGATPNLQPNPEDLAPFWPVGPFGGFDGGTERTIFQGYAQDKVDLLNNTLHLTPGVTLEGTYSSFDQGYVFNPPLGYFEHYKATKWDREWLPFFNAAYDLDQVAPMLKGVTVYGSYGESALFAPVTDFGPNTAGAPPSASIVHMYEGGIKYITPTVAVSADYFYQKVDRDFGFYTAQSGPEAGYSIYNDNGQREFKGVEFNGIWQVMPDLQLFGNFSKTLAKYLASNFGYATVSEDQFGIDLKGAPISGVPDWISTFGADWSRKSTMVDGDAIGIRIGEQYTGHQATTYDILGNAVVPNFPGLGPVGPCVPPGIGSGCTRFAQLSGATVYDPNGGNNPYWVTNVDMNYTLPTPTLPVLKSVKFDLNVQNLFNAHFAQYLYKQVSPSACPATPSNPVASEYNCTPSYADEIPGQPFSVFFTVTAHF
jgi:iron complex outermembrane receptor protein